LAAGLFLAGYPAQLDPAERHRSLDARPAYLPLAELRHD
jgi:hypothetical protein